VIEVPADLPQAHNADSDFPVTHGPPPSSAKLSTHVAPILYPSI
jgi:hypothetical protein